MAQWLTNQLVTMRLHIRSLALLSGSRIQHYCGCGAGHHHSSNSTPSLGTSICHMCGPTKKKKKRKKTKTKDQNTHTKKMLCHIQNICHVLSTMDYLMTDEK